MLEAFIDWRPIGRSEYLLNVINRLAAPFIEKGIDLTPSQVFGLLVEEGTFDPSDTIARPVQDILNRGHLAGRIDWSVGKDTSMHFFGEEGGLEVWVDRDDLVRNTLRAVEGFRAGVMVTRGEPSTSALYQAVKRAPKVIVIVGDGRSYERRLRTLGFEGEVESISTKEGVTSFEHMTPLHYQEAVGDYALFFFDEPTTAVDLAAEVAQYQEDVERGDRVLDSTRKRLSKIEIGLGVAMDSVGDTTRAAALKKKITALIEEA